MVQVYNILDKLKVHFEGNGITRKVTFGNNANMTNDKTSSLPLAHIDIIDASFGSSAITFRMRVACMDLVNVSKVVEPDDEFYGGDNQHDVLNAQFVVLTKLINSLRSGDLFDDKHQLGNDPTALIFDFETDANIIGWGAEIEIIVKNDISAC